MSERSTKRQKELLSFVDGFIREHGYGPSYREIMRGLDYKSVSTVAIHIDGLISKGYLAKRDNSARSLEVVSIQPAAAQPAAKSARTGHEKWLLDKVDQRFRQYEDHKEPKILDEVYVLVAAMKVLGLSESYEAAHARLGALEQSLAAK